MGVVHEPTAGAADRQVSRLATWSLLMVPVFVVVFVVTSLVGEYLVLDLLGLPEGSLFLMEGGIAGWTAEVLSAVLLAGGPVAGLWLAVRALRGGSRHKAWAWAGLIVNALLVVLVAFMFVDAIRMSYFAPLD
jgi:hypothetical protein